MDSKIIHQIAKHIKEVYFGKNWTWVNLKEQLADVTWQEATTQIDSLNTILGLTYHIHYYVAPMNSVLNGGPKTGKDELSFDHPVVNSQEDWNNFLNTIYNEVEALVIRVKQLEEERLWKIYSEEKYGIYFRNILGFVEHAHYHLGQIVVIKKMIRKRMEASIQDESLDDTQEIMQVLSDYALGLDILDGYDHQSLEIAYTHQYVAYRIIYDDAINTIQQLKVKFGGGDLFGNEKDESFKSSISAIDQTFDGKELYPSIEEKAAHLLYFVVKNHSFSDGNKRIAAWIFVWYLFKNNHLYTLDGQKRIANNALAALTLMIALSKPEEKELMIKVVVNSINTKN